MALVISALPAYRSFLGLGHGSSFIYGDTHARDAGDCSNGD